MLHKGRLAARRGPMAGRGMSRRVGAVAVSVMTLALPLAFGPSGASAAPSAGGASSAGAPPETGPVPAAVGVAPVSRIVTGKAESSRLARTDESLLGRTGTDQV